MAGSAQGMADLRWPALCPFVPPPPATSNVGGGSRIRALRAPCVRAARRSSAHGVAASTLASLSDDSRHGAAPAAMRPALLSMAILDLILFCFSCLCPSQFIAPRFEMIFMVSIVAVGLGLKVGGGRRGAGQQLGSICRGQEYLQAAASVPPSCSFLLTIAGAIDLPWMRPSSCSIKWA